MTTILLCCFFHRVFEVPHFSSLYTRIIRRWKRRPSTPHVYKYRPLICMSRTPSVTTPVRVICVDLWTSFQVIIGNIVSCGPFESCWVSDTLLFRWKLLISQTLTLPTPISKERFQHRQLYNFVSFWTVKRQTQRTTSKTQIYLSEILKQHIYPRHKDSELPVNAVERWEYSNF